MNVKRYNSIFKKQRFFRTIIAASFSVILIFGTVGIGLTSQQQPQQDAHASSQTQGPPIQSTISTQTSPPPKCNANSLTLQLRSAGANVVELQTLLVQLGYGSLLGQSGIDGKFGTGTENAVKKFQQDNGLLDNGIVGPAIWAALCKVVTTVGQSSSTQPIQIPSQQNAPPQISPSTDCDPTKSEIVYTSKVYRKGPWQFLYGVYKGQGLFVRHLSANSNPLLDSLSVPHFKIDYGEGKSKIIRFCNDQTLEPRIFSEVNPAGKKYDRLGWGFERVMNEPDLKGVLRVNYDIIIRTDPVSNCEPGENVCYRFIPLVSFSWKQPPFPSSCSVEQLKNCTIQQQIPQKFSKFTAFYKLDYGDESGLVSVRDYNFNLANVAIVGLQKFIPTENKFQAVINGRQGQTDNFHNAHLGQEVFLPGCRNSNGDCLHMHLRWGDMTPTIDPLVFPITDSPVCYTDAPSTSPCTSYEGEPYLVPGQTIDIALVKYSPQEAFPTDPTALVNGENIGSTKTKTQFIQGRDGPRAYYFHTLGSSYHPVMWYTASASNTDRNEFFGHGMFVLDFTK
jgi:hypothetical protein